MTNNPLYAPDVANMLGVDAIWVIRVNGGEYEWETNTPVTRIYRKSLAQRIFDLWFAATASLLRVTLLQVTQLHGVDNQGDFKIRFTLTPVAYYADPEFRFNLQDRVKIAKEQGRPLGFEYAVVIGRVISKMTDPHKAFYRMYIIQKTDNSLAYVEESQLSTVHFFEELPDLADKGAVIDWLEQALHTNPRNLWCLQSGAFVWKTKVSGVYELTLVDALMLLYQAVGNTYYILIERIDAEASERRYVFNLAPHDNGIVERQLNEGDSIYFTMPVSGSATQGTIRAVFLYKRPEYQDEYRNWVIVESVDPTNNQNELIFFSEQFMLDRTISRLVDENSSDPEIVEIQTKAYTQTVNQVRTEFDPVLEHLGEEAVRQYPLLLLRYCYYLEGQLITAKGHSSPSERYLDNLIREYLDTSIRLIEDRQD